MLLRSKIVALAPMGLLLLAACGTSPQTPASNGGTNTHAAAGNADSGGSGSGSGSGSNGQVDLCKTLTAAQAQSILGRPIGPATKETDGLVGCGWSATGEFDRSGIVILYVDPGVYEGAKSASQSGQGMKLTAIPGLGDEAFVTPLDGQTEPLLTMKKGPVVVSVSVVLASTGAPTGTQATNLAAEKQVAAIVASQL